MIKDLSSALRQLINSLSIRPLTTLVAIFFISIGYITLKSYDRLEDLVVTPHEEASRFRKQLDNAALVNDAIENLRLTLKANNVVVKQFHNGKHDLTGLPFTESTSTFYTATYTSLGDEPLSSMNNSLRLMWREIDMPECIVIYSPSDVSTAKYFAEYKLIKEVRCPLTNLLNYPIGVISVGFSEGNTTNDQAAVTKTAAIAKRITGYLNDY